MTIATDEVRPGWKEVVLSFAPPAKRDERRRRLLDKLPLTLILVGQTVFTWRLVNVTSNDEALYIDAGHDVINHLVHGSPLPDYGSYFSGAPGLYPVLAGSLDSVGGLTVVRLFSLLCMLSATLCVYAAALRVFDRRVALFASLTCATTGSVLYVGKFATYDATCVALIALALYLAVSRRSVLSGVGVGLILALAMATKYATVALVPGVVILCGLAGSAYLARDICRAIVAAAVAGGSLYGAFHFWGSSVAGGVAFTTTSRAAEGYQSYASLLTSLVRDIGILTAIAVVGAALLVRSHSWRRALIALTCLGSGLALPASQVHIHEFVSLDKHTDFAGILLALPAGYALDWAFTRRSMIKIATCTAVWFMFIGGLATSSLEYSWPGTIIKPINYILEHPVAGQYLSFDASTAAYYTKKEPQVSWNTAFYVFSQGTPAVTRAVTSHVYAGFLYRLGENNATIDAELRQLAAALGRDPYYHLTASYRVDPYHSYDWVLWQRVDSAPVPTSASATSSQLSADMTRAQSATPTRRIVAQAAGFSVRPADSPASFNAGGPPWLAEGSARGNRSQEC